MHANTLKTVWGYFKSKLNLPKKSQSLSDIYNYLPITDTLATSGQPTAEQFALIKQAGYQVVINLAPSQANNAIANEDAVVAKMGLDYIHIPVDFKNPTQEDFNTFATNMQQLSNRKIWIHCAANMRVSAFIYKYRHDVLGEDETKPSKDLHKIWQPYGVWKDFLSPTGWNKE
ncbi:protein tyrosine phosphatase family protein [Methylophaga sp. OBS4]|uniref:protein tyrosine phosphatase family protein n=1 Tax=Methylophaga sp. OBS4 TaxID=2991935 RepID=UPI00225B9145|nr:protein tyrosine phosphatase family protein [Methylophaga sp. OBS4]MCX4187269.1 protein tyrosine phosphatase family protein [Methylophaga sp. OBS4]